MIGLVFFVVFIAYLFLAAFMAFEEVDWNDIETGDDSEKERTSSGLDSRDRGIDLDLQGKD